MKPNVDALLNVVKTEDVRFETFQTTVYSDGGGFGVNNMIEHMKKYLTWLKEKGNSITVIDRTDTMLDKNDIRNMKTNKKVLISLRTVIAYKKNPEGSAFR